MKKTIVLTLAVFMFGAALFGALSVNVSAQAYVPTWDVGDGWYFGNTEDFSELQSEIDQGLAEGLAELPGFDASVDVAGGVGIYGGIEVVDTNYNLNGINCYKVDFTGAVGIDFGLEFSVDGAMNYDFMELEIDAAGNMVIVGEANLDGSLYFTVNELAFAKGEFTFTADVTADVVIDAYIKFFMDMSGYGGGVESIEGNIDVDISVDISDVVITGSLEFDPPIDIFDFPIYEYDTWQVPGVDTDVTGSLTGAGTIDVNVEVSGIDDLVGAPGNDINEHESIDLGIEIGSHTETSMIDAWDSIGLRCTAVYGDNYIIETELDQFFNYYDWGVRQFGLNPMDLVGDVLPSDVGIQYSATDGFINGVSVDGEVTTSTATESEVNSFAAAPLDEIQEVTGGHGDTGTGSLGEDGIFPLLLLGIIVVVVVLVVVAVIAGRRKKKGPEEMYGAPQQQPQEPDYQQPSPPPPPEGY